MHRRVAQTVAAVLPQTYAWGGTKQWDPAEVTHDGFLGNNEYYSSGIPDSIGQPGPDSSYHVNDVYDYSSGQPQTQWRRMDSHGESILSGLSGEDGQERMRNSPESMRRGSSLGRVAEEGQIDIAGEVEEAHLHFVEPVDPEEAVEWELEENGLYGGSYKRLLAMYTFVPSTAFIAFVVLGFLPLAAWPSSTAPSRYPAIFPSPLPELFLSSAMFSLAHLLRVPLYMLSLLLVRPSIASLLSTFLHVSVINILRLVSFALLEVRHNMMYPTPAWEDPAFRTVWWLSLNIAEVAVAVVQGYQQIALYRDVMVPKGREQEFLERVKHVATPQQNNGVLPNSWDESSERTPEETQSNLGEPEDPLRQALRRSTDVLDIQIDRDIDKLLAVKSREELEEVYGLPVIKIPVFVSCLQRFNSIILSLGLNLLLSCAYLRSPISIPVSDSNKSNPYPGHWHSPLLVTFPIILIIHTSLASLYTPTILPRIGVHTAAYVGVLVGLMCFFAGLAVWKALS